MEQVFTTRQIHQITKDINVTKLQLWRMLWRKGTWCTSMGDLITSAGSEKATPRSEIKEWTGVRWVERRGTMSDRENSMFKTFPQSVHLSPAPPLLPWSNSQAHSHVRVFEFSSPWLPFAWISLPHDLCRVHYLFIQIPTLREAPQDSLPAQ